MSFSRANAVPEMAFVISFTLLVLYGAIQLATTAFYQISADGATFVAAHDTVQSVGNPTSANASAAGSSAAGAFAKILSSSVSALNPSASTFEADVSQNVPGITGVGSSHPLTISSRLIEESNGTASPSPISNCAQGSLNLSNGATKLVTNQAVGLLQGGTLVSLGTLSGATSPTLNLSATPVATRVNVLLSVGTSLSSLVSTLQGLQASINGLGSTPIVGPLLSPLISSLLSYIGSDLQGPVASAFAGTYNSTTALVNMNAELATQIPALGSLLATYIDPLLTGGTLGTGVLGSNGPLASLNTAEVALKAIDAGAVTCP